MTDTIDNEARARAAEALRRMSSGSDSFSLAKSFVSGIKTRDAAVRPVLKEARAIVKTAALRAKQDGAPASTVSLTEDERKQMGYYVLFLESGSPMADMTTRISGRTLWFAIGAYIIPVIIETFGFWFVLRNLRGALCAALVVSAFIYALVVFGLMIGSVPKERRRSLEHQEELEPLGVSSLWPFGSIDDLRSAMEAVEA